mgnify:CR=1 FL=1
MLRPSGRPLDGGNCTTRGCDTPATHRLRASCSAKPPPPPSWSAPAGPEGPAPVPMSGKSPATGPKGGPLPVQNSPSTSRAALLPVQNSPCSPEMAQFGAFSTCRESFVPFSPPRSRAGRILYRTRGRDRVSQHNRTPCPTCVEGAGGTGGYGRIRGDAQSRTSTTWPHWYGGRRRARRARPRRQWITGPGRGIRKRQQHPAQANFACNSPTTRIDARSKTAEYQRSDFNT